MHIAYEIDKETCLKIEGVCLVRFIFLPGVDGVFEMTALRLTYLEYNIAQDLTIDKGRRISDDIMKASTSAVTITSEFPTNGSVKANNLKYKWYYWTRKLSRIGIFMCYS